MNTHARVHQPLWMDVSTNRVVVLLGQGGNFKRVQQQLSATPYCNSFLHSVRPQRPPQRRRQQQQQQQHRFQLQLQPQRTLRRCDATTLRHYDTTTLRRCAPQQQQQQQQQPPPPPRIQTNTNKQQRTTTEPTDRNHQHIDRSITDGQSSVSNCGWLTDHRPTDRPTAALATHSPTHSLATHSSQQQPTD